MAQLLFVSLLCISKNNSFLLHTDYQENSIKQYGIVNFFGSNKKKRCELMIQMKYFQSVLTALCRIMVLMTVSTVSGLCIDLIGCDFLSFWLSLKRRG
jgi:hypothetical protein